jgi:hypothetical protein
MISTVVELISGTRPHIEGGAVQNRCAAACRGEAAIASHCMIRSFCAQQHTAVDIRLLT